MAAKNILSVFIDESGDFGAYSSHSPYYMVAMVLHEQSSDISKDINALDNRVKDLRFPPHAIHVGPIIRRESIYLNQYDDIVARKALLNALYHFTRQLNIHYICPVVKKSECVDFTELNSKLSKAIASEFRIHEDYFNSFDKIIVYYDNGQDELKKIITKLFSAFFPDVEFRKVQPSEYKLFQVADLICTWEMTALKAEQNNFSSSEMEFFDSPREFKKNRLKPIRKKKL